MFDVDRTFFGSVDEHGNIYDHADRFRARTVLSDTKNGYWVYNVNNQLVGTLYSGGKASTAGLPAALVRPYDIRLDEDGKIWKLVGYTESTASIQVISTMEPSSRDLHRPLGFCAGAVYLLTRSAMLFPNNGYREPEPRWLVPDRRYFKL